jgi:hypothetical protein
MSHRRLLMATALLTSAVLIGCSDTTAPDQLVPAGSSARQSGRSGTLHVEKECSQYFGGSGEFCSITLSSLQEIKVRSRIYYASDAGADGTLDTDVRLVSRGSGRDVALGHCTLSLITGIGECIFSGGTGKFTGFEARVAVSPLGGPNFAWDGTYSFTPLD